MGILYFRPFRKDSHSLFEELVSPHLSNLYKLAYHLTGKRDDAEDLVQEVLLKLFPRLEEMQAIEKLGPWLTRVLYRLFIDQLRRQQRSPIEPISDEDTFYATHASQQAGPSEETNSIMTLELINSALLKLSDEHRVLIILHDVEGYSLQEINQVTDIPLGTIKSRLSRARCMLRETLRIREPRFADSVNSSRRV